MLNGLRIWWAARKLRSAHFQVRFAAAQALVKLQGVKALIKALGDGDENVRIEAARALGNLGDARAVEPLSEALCDSDFHVQLIAAEALVKMHAVVTLIEALGTGHSGVPYAAEALGELKDARAVAPLIKALKDSQRLVRDAAAHALGKLGDALAVEPLINALEDNEWSVRYAAARALGKLGNARAVEPLINALEDGEPRTAADAISIAYMKRTAAEALGELGDVRAVQALTRALKDRDGSVRSTAAEARAKLGGAR